MSVVDRNLVAEIDEIMPGVIEDRRFLHQNPELGLQEHKTAAYIAERLKAIGVEDIRTGVGVTGVTALIHGTKPGPKRTVMLRADMDALPIQELNDVEYKSTVPGVMHACGHDAHVSMLLGAAQVLMSHRADFPGTVKVLFQPAEEGLGGAGRMIRDGAMEGVDATFGLHIWQGTDLGTVEVRNGVAMVAADGFNLTITGKGGHGGLPHDCVDPIAIGAQVVTALQNLISREMDPNLPAVITIGAFHAGEASNVIPETAELRASVRTVNREQRERLLRRIGEVCTGIATAMGGSAEIDIRHGVPPVINDPVMADFVRAAAADMVGAENVVEGVLKNVSEDYSEFMELVPGCYFFVGSRNADRGLTWGHHHARFDIDEEAMSTGIGCLAGSAMRYLNSEA